MEEQVRECLLLFLLAVCAGQDIRRHEVWIPIPFCGLTAGILITLLSDGLSLYSVAAGIGTGAGLIGFSLLSGGKIGCGDGWVIAAAGALLGVVRTLELLMTALLSAMAVSALLLILRRRRKTDEIPFVPFVLAAYLMMLAE